MDGKDKSEKPKLADSKKDVSETINFRQELSRIRELGKETAKQTSKSIRPKTGNVNCSGRKQRPQMGKKSTGEPHIRRKFPGGTRTQLIEPSR